MKTLLCTLILATLGTAAAHAATITITLDQPNQFATPGTTVDFTGTITNNTTGTVFLNSDSFNLGGLSLTLDDSPFFANAPLSLRPAPTPATSRSLTSPSPTPSSTQPDSTPEASASSVA